MSGLCFCADHFPGLSGLFWIITLLSNTYFVLQVNTICKFNKECFDSVIKVTAQYLILSRQDLCGFTLTSTFQFGSDLWVTRIQLSKQFLPSVLSLFCPVWDSQKSCWSKKKHYIFWITAWGQNVTSASYSAYKRESHSLSIRCFCNYLY